MAGPARGEQTPCLEAFIQSHGYYLDGKLRVAFRWQTPNGGTCGCHVRRICQETPAPGEEGATEDATPNQGRSVPIAEMVTLSFVEDDFGEVQNLRGCYTFP